MRIRDRIRAWLGVEDWSSDLAAALLSQAQRVEALDRRLVQVENEAAEFKRALKAKVAKPVPKHIPDYEAIQVQALEEFRPKEGK